MSAYADATQEMTNTTGTGALTLAGATTGNRSFASAFVNGDRPVFRISNGNQWEVSTGTFNGTTTLNRDVVLSSSNSGALVVLAGSSVVSCVQPTETISDLGRSMAFQMGIGLP